MFSPGEVLLWWLISVNAVLVITLCFCRYVLSADRKYDKPVSLVENEDTTKSINPSDSNEQTKNPGKCQYCAEDVSQDYGIYNTELYCQSYLLTSDPETQSPSNLCCCYSLCCCCKGKVKVLFVCVCVCVCVGG